MNIFTGNDRREAARWRSYAAGAAVITALLAATACDSDPADAADDATSAAPGATSSASPGGAGSTAPGATGSPSGTAATTPDDSAGGGAGSADNAAGKGIPTCTQEDLGVSAVKEPADSKESRHLVITVQNAGDRKCNLYRYPFVQLGADAQTTVPVIKDSDPDRGRPVTVEPGREAYAALLVAGGQRDEYKATSITISLQGPRSGSTPSDPIDVPLPVKALYADDGQLVTYWTTASGYALDFIMSK
ncbi:DUF4232 domain-containing protein [Streptomyces sp. NPDC090306]|uniref:DUF4232 domain-containing protein n=1 Tax=unclassified Streptomyces TaxID=2593676 RepID=UPI0036E09F34